MRGEVTYLFVVVGSVIAGRMLATISDLYQHRSAIWATDFSNATDTLMKDRESAFENVRKWCLKSARSIIRKPLNEICSIHVWSEHIVVIAYKLTLLQGTLLNIHTSAFQTFPTLRPARTRVCAPALCSVIQNCVLDPFQDHQAPS